MFNRFETAFVRQYSNFIRCLNTAPYEMDSFSTARGAPHSSVPKAVSTYPICKHSRNMALTLCDTTQTI